MTDEPRRLAPPAEDDPAARLDRLLAAPVLQAWTPRWNPPLLSAPTSRGPAARWASVSAGIRPRNLPQPLLSGYPTRPRPPQGGIPGRPTLLRPAFRAPAAPPRPDTGR